MQRELGTVDEEQDRYEAMKSALKSLQLECEMNRLEAIAEYYPYKKGWWKRLKQEWEYKRAMQRSNRTAKKVEAQ